MKVLIERINDTGEGIGKINDKIVFVNKTIPGDIVEINNISTHKRYCKASISKIVKKSPDRIEALCPYYEKCGGCQLMNLDYQKQLLYKKEKVIKLFKKYGSLEINPNIIGDNPYHYRNKITLQVKDGHLGLFEYNSNKIVEINSCLLVSNKMNDLIKYIKENIKLTSLTKITIRESDNKNMVVFHGKINKEEALKLQNKVASIYINDKHIYGDKNLISNLENYSFNISSDSFFQVNHAQTIKLYNKILESIPKNKKVLDLYCGTGSIGIYISKKCESILGIEINENAIKDANKNKKINNIKNISFKCGDVEKIITSKDNYDTIIVDPPRSGLSKKTRRTILEIESNTINYVSCNPITLIRDIKELSSKYNLKDITLFDLFPNTYHVESISLLRLKK